jgi:hypothetical protein
MLIACWLIQRGGEEGQQISVWKSADEVTHSKFPQEFNGNVEKGVLTKTNLQF